MGRYRARAGIGRVSQNLDLGRLLNTGLLGLALGGATNKTKRIDVSRLTMRVTRDGYQPFEGVVMCRTLDPGAFAVTMEPVLLSESGKPAVSLSAGGWGTVEITAVRVEPAIVQPGEKAMMTVEVASPPVLKLKDFKAAYEYQAGRDTKSGSLKAQPAQADGKTIFTGEVKTTKAAKAYVEELMAVLSEVPYDVKRGGRTEPVLFQIVTSDAEREVAVKRAAAYDLARAGKTAEAAVQFQSICNGPLPLPWDYRMLASLSERTHDTAAATAAWKKIAELAPEKERTAAESGVAEAMVASGQAASVISTWAPQVAAVKAKDRAKKFPAALMVALGEAYLQAGDLNAATGVNQELLSRKDAETAAVAAPFQGKLRLLTAKAAAEAQPANGAARADYGRVLMDQGRWDEAIPELRAAALREPNLPAVRRDLAYAQLHARAAPDAATAPVDLDAAIQSAAQETAIIKKNGSADKSKDFFAWHALAILLYSKAAAQSAAGDAAAGETLVKSQDALREALRVARTGAAVDQGSYDFFFGYTSARVKAIAGFAYKEADSDFVILESLAALQTHPDDYLAHFNLASAFADLQQPRLAKSESARALALKPGYVEAQYVQALADVQLGETSEAIGLLQAVLKANPNHPRANLTLARLYTEQGDMGAAAACLAAHARVYGGV
jgi:tetratricopeptide (TPR) repeat protein